MPSSPRRPRAALILLAAVVGLTGLAPAASADDSYPPPADGSYSFHGRGWGHGRGMSQWGAFRAAQLGNTAAQITAFYYSTSTAGSFANRTMRVLLTGTDGDRVIGVRNQAGLVATVYAADQVTSLGSRALTDHAVWRVGTDAGGLRVQWQNGTAWENVEIGGTTSFGNGALVDVRASAPLPLYDEDGGTPPVYRGGYRVTRLDASRTRTVNHVLLEEQYLPSVVPSESIASWPAAALQAQAIAARSYSAWYEQHPQATDYDLCDTTACQVYTGVGAEDSRTTSAVDATRGQVRVVGGAVVRTEFSSSNGGSVNPGGTGHSPPKYDPWSDGSWDPRHDWSKEVSAAAAAAAVFGAGAQLTDMRVTERNRYGDWGGQVQSVTFTGVLAGSPVTRVMTGQQVRTAFGLNSAHFTVEGSGVTRWQLSSGQSAGSAADTFTYGPAGAGTLVGDWNADGRQTAGVLDRPTGAWRWRLTDTNDIGPPTTTFSYGPGSCTPVTGSWDGAGASHPGMVCADNGQWYWRLRNANSGGPPSLQFHYGPTTCQPVIGDWNGDGRDTPGAVCPTDGELRWRLSNVNGTSSPAYDFRYGPVGARTVVGDWNGDGRATIGVVRLIGGRWLWSLRDANSAGPASRSFDYGVTAQRPVPGDWNGDGAATAGLVF